MLGSQQVLNKICGVNEHGMVPKTLRCWVPLRSQPEGAQGSGLLPVTRALSLADSLAGLRLPAWPRAPPRARPVRTPCAGPGSFSCMCSRRLGWLPGGGRSGVRLAHVYPYAGWWASPAKAQPQCPGVPFAPSSAPSPRSGLAAPLCSSAPPRWPWTPAASLLVRVPHLLHLFPSPLPGRRPASRLRPPSALLVL